MFGHTGPFSYSRTQDDLPHQLRGLSQDDPHQRRGFSSDDFPHQKRGFSQDDFPPQRRGFSSDDDFPPQRRGFSPDDFPSQRRGFSSDDFPSQRRGFSSDDFPPQRRGFSPDDFPPQRRGFSSDDFPPQRRGFSSDDFPPQRRGFSSDDFPHQRSSFSQNDPPHQKGGFSQDDFPHQRRGFPQDDFPHQRRGFSQDDFPHQRRGFSQDDLPYQRRGFQPDDLRGPPSQRNSTSRPNGKSIYNQRKEYSETLNKHSDNFNFRVEHLFTCELDGLELKTIDDCVAKLKRLDAKGRLWPQEMIMEIQGGYLLLSDIETQIELEALPFSSMLQTTAVLDSCAYNSLLTVTVQERRKRHPQVYLFQCEETGAELIKNDLEQVIQIQGGDVEPERKKEQPDIRINLENILGQHTLAGWRQAVPRPVQREMSPPPPEEPSPQLKEPEYMALPRAYSPPEPSTPEPELELRNSPEVPLTPAPTESQRNAEIFNHVLKDLEIFMDKVAAATEAPSVKGTKKKKNGMMKKKSKKAEPAASLPPWKEYVSCLQKFKYGFNLLGQLDGSLSSPSAADFIHIFFSGLGNIVPKYPADLPPTVISPLLTVPALRLLSQVVSPEEDRLWVTLGDSWNLPRSRWPEEVPPYIPDFYDGWQPPPPSQLLQNGRSTRNSQRLPPGQRQPEEPMTKSPWSSPSPAPNSESPKHMRVIYDFAARNNHELSVTKGDKVQVVQKSKQWWLVRNSRNEEGHVPQNVLEPMKSSGPMNNAPRDTRGAVTLDMNSTAAEVKAWLQYKGFSKITISSLGVLTGKLLLGMTKGELRTVCPEEGGKVFFQLQAIKSAIALASEPSGQYNGHY